MMNKRKYSGKDIEKLGDLFREKGMSMSQCVDCTYEVIKALDMEPDDELLKEFEDFRQSKTDFLTKLRDSIKISRANIKTGEIEEVDPIEFLRGIFDFD